MYGVHIHHITSMCAKSNALVLSCDLVLILEYRRHVPWGLRIKLWTKGIGDTSEKIKRQENKAIKVRK